MSNVLATNDVLVSEVVCNLAAQQQSSTTRRAWKVASITGAGIVQFLDVATALDTLWGPDFIALLTNAATYNGTRVRRLDPVNVDQWETMNAGAGAGTAGATALPSQTCGLLKVSGNTIGKHGQGRIYLPFPASADDTGAGLPTAGYLTRADTLGLDVVSPLSVVVGGTTALLLPGLWNTLARAFTSINKFLSEGAWATQMRRGAFGRFNRPPF